MAENLRVTHLTNSTPISLVENNTAWTNLTEPGMCWYSNDSVNYNFPYGRIYNGYTALCTNLCPVGWQVPSTHEWDMMITFLGGASVAGGKMKHVGTQYWNDPNAGATNSSGFTGLPGGFRSNTDGTFNYKGQRGGWFVLDGGTGTGGYTDVAFRFLSWSMESSGSGSIAKNAGLNIRCFRSYTTVDDKDVMRLQFNIYPNPCNTYLNISIKDYNPLSFYRVELVDCTGRKVTEEVFKSGNHTLNLNGITAGFYFLKLYIDSKLIENQKVIITGDE
jgi:uncharacterized protein (TIGR02145 family)